MIIKLDLFFTSLLGFVPIIIFAYHLSKKMDAAGDHSDPLPNNWQTMVEEAIRADTNS